MLWIKEKNSYWKQWILSVILPSFAVNTAFLLRQDISGKSRFIQEGFAGLFDQSKRPDNSLTQIDEETIIEIIKLKIKKKHWVLKK